MKALVYLMLALALVFAVGCGKNPVAVNDDGNLEKQIDALKLEKHETYNVKFTIDYSNRNILDDGTYNWNENTRMEHVYEVLWNGGVVAGDFVGKDTLTKYSHWAHILEDGSSDRFFRHGNCQWVVTWKNMEFPFHVMWSLKEGRDYAYGWNFGALYKDAANKCYWVIEAELKAETWDACYFTCEGFLKKFYFEKRQGGKLGEVE